MDHTFLYVTIVFIIFILISYYLNIIKLSTPLILIYLVFCFSFVIDKDIGNNDFVDNEEKKINEISSITGIPKKQSKKKVNEGNKKLDISKPVVSFNPKPIVIDSNLIIQKDKGSKNDTDSIPKKLITQVKTEDDLSKLLNLNEVMICRGVYKRNPIKPGFTFANNVDSLFCYTKISNKGSKQEIKHLWYYEDKLVTSVVYNIKTSYNYRSWSKKTILPTQLGQWRVDIVDSRDTILGTRKFQISSINNSF